MTTAAARGTNAYDTQAEQDRTAARVHVGRTGIGTVGVLTVLISAWGALIPFVGPIFGYRGTGVPSWHWGAAHALLALLPGGIGVVMRFVVLRGTSRVAVGRGRMSLALAGLIILLCGAWFVVGPFAWPVITTHGAYFAPAAPLRFLLYLVGYALGTGVILVMCGGYVMGWASRHQRSAAPTVSSDVAPASEAAHPVVAPAHAPAHAAPAQAVAPAPVAPAPAVTPVAPDSAQAGAPASAAPSVPLEEPDHGADPPPNPPAQTV